MYDNTVLSALLKDNSFLTVYGILCAVDKVSQDLQTRISDMIIQLFNNNGADEFSTLEQCKEYKESVSYYEILRKCHINESSSLICAKINSIIQTPWHDNCQLIGDESASCIIESTLSDIKTSIDEISWNL